MSFRLGDTMSRANAAKGVAHMRGLGGRPAHCYAAGACIQRTAVYIVHEVTAGNPPPNIALPRLR